MAVIETMEATKAPRRRVLDTGLIRFGDLSVCCVISNFSDAAAVLDVSPQSLLPDQFTLIVVQKKMKIYSCNVIWRRGARIGVSFC
jgi:hypothetical protein